MGRKLHQIASPLFVHFACSPKYQVQIVIVTLTYCLPIFHEWLQHITQRNLANKPSYKPNTTYKRKYWRKQNCSQSLILSTPILTSQQARMYVNKLTANSRNQQKHKLEKPWQTSAKISRSLTYNFGSKTRTFQTQIKSISSLTNSP